MLSLSVLFGLLRSSLRGMRALLCLLLISSALSLSSCTLPQVKAEDRLFLPLKLDYLSSYTLPREFDQLPLGGLSGITYDRQRNRFYAISDDRSQQGPARFYTLKLDLDQAAQPAIQTVTVEQMTVLKTKEGEPFAPDTIDFEGIALSPYQSVFVASEGIADRNIAPFIAEFDLATGNWRSQLPMSNRYLPSAEAPQGVQNNQGFESLTVNAGSYGTTQLEPFRLFTATESALKQDLPTDAASPSTPIRFLHYLVGQDQKLLLSEHFYPIDPVPEGGNNLGLSELLVLDQGGHFLSLERGFGITGFSSKIFQLVTGGATDIAPIPSLAAGTSGLTPVYKRLILDLSDLGIPLDNFEGMTLGPQLADGSQSLILISDDNFNPLQTSQLLLFRLQQER